VRASSRLRGTRPFGELDDQIDLALTSSGTKMSDLGLALLRVGHHAERDERFEEGAEQRPVSDDRWAAAAPSPASRLTS